MKPEDTPLNTIRTSRPAQDALKEGGYHTLGDLTRSTERDVLRLHGMGPKALGILRQVMQEHGLSFATEDEKTEGKGK